MWFITFLESNFLYTRGKTKFRIKAARTYTAQMDKTCSWLIKLKDWRRVDGITSLIYYCYRKRKRMVRKRQRVDGRKLKIGKINEEKDKELEYFLTMMLLAGILRTCALCASSCIISIVSWNCMAPCLPYFYYLSNGTTQFMIIWCSYVFGCKIHYHCIWFETMFFFF